MAGDRHRHRSSRGADLRFHLIARTALLLVLGAWAAIAFWNSVKPLPPGTRATSQSSRLSESDLDFVDAAAHQNVLGRTLTVVERAEQLVVIDESPLPREVAQALLLRKHARPHLKVVVIVDPAPAVFGGTPYQDLQSLEAAGIIVARVRLERLRDPNPMYSSVWRMSFGWWSDPFDEAARPDNAAARARRLNAKFDRRQILVADDGAGGWVSLSGSPLSDAVLWLHGAPAQDILAAELSLAAWSGEDRLPAVPPAHGRGFGTVDARFLTEGAIAGALLDSLAVLHAGDTVALSTPQLGDRAVIAALIHAAARGVKLQLLLDVLPSPNLAAAGELRRADTQIDLRWATNAPGVETPDVDPPRATLILMRRGNDAVIYVGSENLTRRSLGDFNLESAIELRAPARATLPRSCADYFARRWAAAAPYARYADESDATYWGYRFADATGLSSF